MSTIDDPTIPDDLSALLRAGSAHLAVAPADLRSVERRARQRRRRRHGIAATGAAAVVLLAGLAIAQVGRSQPEHETVIATTPPAEKPDSVPQPLLVRRDWKVSEVPAGLDPNDWGWALDSVTADGTTPYWGATSRWHPVGAYELADGRRFGVAATMSTGLGIPPKARLDEIGTRADTISSKALPLEVPWGSFSASIQPIGTTANEIILQRDVQRSQPVDDVFFKVLDTTTFTAIDVDSGAERPLFEVEGMPGSGIPAIAAAADDVLVRAVDGECRIVVSTLTGGDARTIPGACPQEPGQTGRRAIDVTVSPDGRYASVLWTGIADWGLSVDLFEVIDVKRGTSIGTAKTEAGTFEARAWTGQRRLSVARRADQQPITIDAGPVTVRTIVTEAGGD